MGYNKIEYLSPWWQSISPSEMNDGIRQPGGIFSFFSTFATLDSRKILSAETGFDKNEKGF